MKKVLVFLMLLTLISMMSVQAQVLLEESFEGVTSFPTASGWTVGADFAGIDPLYNNWKITSGTSPHGTQHVRSWSWDDETGVAYTPDNLLCAPSIELPQIDHTNGLFWVVSYSVLGNQYNAETYSVRGHSAPIGGTTLGTQIFTEDYSATSWSARKVVIPPALYGGTFYLAFHHHEPSNDGFYIGIDNVKVEQVQALQYDLAIAAYNIPHNLGVTGSASGTLVVNGSVTIENKSYTNVAANEYTLVLRDAKNASYTQNLTTVAIDLLGSAVFPFTISIPQNTAAHLREYYVELSYSPDLDTSNNAVGPLWRYVYNNAATQNTTVNPTLVDVNHGSVNGWGTTTTNAVTHPFNFNSYNNVAQVIYKASEVGGSGLITHIRYRYSASATHPLSQGHNIWMGYTASESFASATAAAWIPLSEFTEVLKSVPNSQTPNNPNFGSGSSARDIWVALETPFYYDATKGNLVVMTFKEFMGVNAVNNLNWVTKTGTAAAGGTNRVLHYASSANYVLPTNFSTTTPTRVSTVPMTSFLKIAGNITLTGTVTSASGTEEGVSVRVNGLPISTMTNAYGQFTLSNFSATNTGITVEALGLRPFSSTALVEAGNPAGLIVDGTTWTYNVFLESTAKSTVSGTVQTAWNAANVTNHPLKLIHPSGVEYSGTTDGSGTFSIQVPSALGSTTTYRIVIDKTHYQTYTSTFTVEADPGSGTTVTPVALGTINLVEDFKAPIAFRAVEGDDNIDMTWFAPTTPSARVTHQVEEGTGYLGFSDTSGGESIVGHRYSREMINALGIADHQIHRVSFMGHRADAVMSSWAIEIYRTQANLTNITNINPADVIDGGHRVYSQVVPLNSVIPNAWNHVDLDQLIPVTAAGQSGELWVMVRGVAVSGYFAMMDYSGNTPNGYSNVTKWGSNAWGALSDLNSAFTYRWCVVAHTVHPTATPDVHMPLVVSMPAYTESGSNDFSILAMDSPVPAMGSYFFSGADLTRAVTSYQLGYHKVNTPNIVTSIANNITATTYSHPTLSAPVGEAFRYVLTATYNTTNVSPEVYSQVLTIAGAEVTITVEDYEGGLELASVRLTHSVLNSIQFAGVTDEEGEVVFTNVGKGSYNVTIERIGFMPINATLEVDADTIEETYSLLVGAVIYAESFEGEQFPPNGWQDFDVDGDNYTWIHGESFQSVPIDGQYHATSESYCSETGTCLYPDNWLISPVIHLPAGTSPDGEATILTLSFYAKASGRVTDTETFSVYAITSPITNQASLTAMLIPDTTVPNWSYGGMSSSHGEEISKVTLNGRGWVNTTIDLATYAGQSVSFGFRHWHSADNLYLTLDDIKIYSNLLTITNAFGKVVDYDVPATPIEDATVIWSSISFPFLTDDLGEFTIPKQFVGYNYNLRVSKDGYHPLEMTGGITAENHNIGNIPIMKYWNVTGTIKSNGATVEGAVVELLGADYEIASVTSAGNGTFTLENVVSGTYTLKVTAASIPTPFTTQVVVAGADKPLGDVHADGTGDDDATLIPAVTALNANYPNPFNPVTTIAYDMAADGHVRIDVYNVKGQKVTTLVNAELKAGKYRVQWTGTDENGRSVGSGIYLYRMQTEKYTSTQKMILMK